MTRRKRREHKRFMAWIQRELFRVAKERILSLARTCAKSGVEYNVKQKLHEAQRNTWYMAERYIIDYEPRWKPQYKCNKPE